MSLPEGFAAIDFDEYHCRTLPALLAAGRAAIVARAAEGRRSIALRLGDGRAYTYRPSRGGVEIVAGDTTAATVLSLDLEAWQGLVHELDAPAGLLYAGRVHCLRGDAVDLMNWESALRALYNGRPAYDGAHLDLRDRHGESIDPQRTFAFGDDRAAMADFLATTGYLFVREVLHGDEVTRMRTEAEVLRGEARKGDKLSWWGKNAGGEEVLCRVTRGSAKPHLRSLCTDARVLALKELAGGPFVYRTGEGEGITVIYKHAGMTEGLGDLPWHRDCGMGGHATMCPVLVMSVYLTEASPETGELCMLPGSMRAAFNAHDPAGAGALASAHFHAHAGDVSLHYSDTVHAAPPPRAADRDQYRISAVISFARPVARHHRGEHSYNDVLHRRGDGQVEHLTTVARRL
jgi:ectoine hydroxylase-related dioxygenase (phytanoyl-CoA dioxygenase family)